VYGLEAIAGFFCELSLGKPHFLSEHSHVLAAIGEAEALGSLGHLMDITSSADLVQVPTIG
jgi:hypothetical protein